MPDYLNTTMFKKYQANYILKIYDRDSEVNYIPHYRSCLGEEMASSEETYVPPPFPLSRLELMRSSVLELQYSELQPRNATAHAP